MQQEYEVWYLVRWHVASYKGLKRPVRPLSSLRGQEWRLVTERSVGHSVGPLVLGLGFRKLLSECQQTIGVVFWEHDDSCPGSAQGWTSFTVPYPVDVFLVVHFVSIRLCPSSSLKIPVSPTNMQFQSPFLFLSLCLPLEKGRGEESEENVGERERWKEEEGTAAAAASTGPRKNLGCWQDAI